MAPKDKLKENMKTYTIRTHDGQTATETSLRRAKVLGKSMARLTTGGGVTMPSPRMWWQEWCDGTIIAHREHGYSGTNPAISIRAS